MIVCNLCQRENSHLAVVCAQCGSFLQTRVDTLDLFTTMWNVIEKPFKTFHRIAIAKHKNYAYILSSLAGIGIAFYAFWLIKASEFSDSLINLIAAAFVIGPPLGILLIQILSMIEKLTMKAFRVDCKYRNLVAVNAYAFIPLVVSLALLVPIKLLTFGTFFFSMNPSPFSLKPTSYVLLLSMDSLFIVWSVTLFVVGAKTLTNARWRLVLSITGVSLILLAVLLTSAVRLISAG